MLRGASLALLASLIVAAPAAAVESASIQTTLEADGSGQLIVSSQTNPSGETWSWQTCAPAGNQCAPFATGQTIGTAGAPAGSIFVARANDGPSASSPVWHGTASSTGSPQVRGAIQANALVTPVAGQWDGGWDGDYDLTQLAACTNPDGTGCTTLTDLHYNSGCPGGGVVIDPVFTGRYLRVADQRTVKDTVFADYAVSSPYGGEAWPAGATTSAAIVGQIARATGPRASACGPPPLEETPQPAKPSPSAPLIPRPGQACPQNASGAACARSPASASLSRRGVARVHCLTACKIVLSARRGARDVRLTRDIDGPKTVSVHLSVRLLRRLGQGRVTFTVAVDGLPRATRRVKLL